MSVTNVNTATNNSSTVAPKAKSATEDRDTFLLLLTTQLKNQDPTDPTDTNQVTQQIAALSSVEQQTKTNTYLEQLLGMYNQSQANTAVSYIGRVVEAEGNQFELANGNAYLHYELPSGTATAEIAISDKNGRVVYTGAGTKVAGKNIVTWDGKNEFTGEVMAPGTYTFQVTAKDASGEKLTATPYISGLVQAVETKDGKQELSLGSFGVPLDKVKAVYNPVIQS